MSSLVAVEAGPKRASCGSFFSWSTAARRTVSRCDWWSGNRRFNVHKKNLDTALYIEAGHVERTWIVSDVSGDDGPDYFEDRSVVLREVLALVSQVDVSDQCYCLKMINKDLGTKEFLLEENIARVFDDLGVFVKSL